MQSLLSSLHSQSLGLAAFVMLLTLSGLTLFFYLTRKTYPGVGYWTAAQALLASGFLLLILRGHIPDWASVLAGNYLLLVGMALFYDGLRHFYGGSMPFRINLTNHALTLVCLGFLAHFLYVDDNVYARVISINCFRVFIAARAFWLVAKQRYRGKELPYSLLGIVLVFASTGLARITIALTSPPVVRFMEQDLNFRISLLLDLIMILVISFGVLLLTHTRIENELDEARGEAERMSRTDQLTGLGNKFHFEAEARREIQRSRRYLNPTSLLLFDIDHFKTINDRFGHVAGDEVLKELARCVLEILRSSDVVYRWGGEEFVVMIPGALDEAIKAAEKLRQKIEHQTFPMAAPLTISIGVAQLRHSEDLDAWMMRADDALYRAKAGGRNRVEVELTDPSRPYPLSLQWNPSFTCGSAVIDRQHKAIFDKANLLLENCRSSNTENITVSMQDLLDAVDRHFAYEEHMLTEIAYPQFAEHAADHARLRDKGKCILNDFKTGKASVGVLADFAITELAFRHIAEEDIHYVEFLSGMRDRNSQSDTPDSPDPSTTT